LIAVPADTHMPKGGRRLPERCVALLGEAEAVLHAGDFFALETLREIEALCPGPVHDAGPAKGRSGRMRRRFPDADAVVFGHSHLPLREEEAGFQIFNPGSPTERRRAPRHSMGLLRVDEGRPRFEHVWL
jgi:predicted phosphodiesterase